MRTEIGFAGVEKGTGDGGGGGGGEGWVCRGIKRFTCRDLRQTRGSLGKVLI